MVLALQASGVERDGTFMDGREVPENQPLGDLGRGETAYRVQDRGLGREGPEGGILTGGVAQEVVDLLVAAEAPGEAGPARPLPAGRKTGPNSGCMPLGLTSIHGAPDPMCRRLTASCRSSR